VRSKGAITMLAADGSKLWSRKIEVEEALLDRSGRAYVQATGLKRSLWAGGKDAENIWPADLTSGDVFLLSSGPALSWSERNYKVPESSQQYNKDQIHLRKLDTQGRALGELVIDYDGFAIIVTSERILVGAKGQFGANLTALNQDGRPLAQRYAASTFPTIVDDEGSYYVESSSDGVSSLEKIDENGVELWTSYWQGHVSQGFRQKIGGIGSKHVLYVGVLEEPETNSSSISQVEALRPDGTEQWTVRICERDCDLPMLAIGPTGIVYAAAGGRLTAIDTGIAGKPLTSWSETVRPGKSPLAVPFNPPTQ
jgi:hypothetical protein